MSRKIPALCALAAALLLLVSCAMVEAAPISAQYLTETAVISDNQVGTPDALMVSEGDFSYVVLYPKTGYPLLDEALAGWAGDAVEDAVTARTMSDDGRLGGELLVQYSTHVRDARYLCVVLAGQYVSRGSAEAVDYIKTFNYDILEDRLLSAIDLFPYTVHPQMFALIEDKLASLNPELDTARLGVSAAWLEQAVLAEESLQLILRENRLNLDSWPERLVFSYPQLEGVLMLNRETPPHSVSLEEPDSAAQDIPGTPDIPVQADVLDPEKPMLALTFDDGPSKLTDALLDLLARHHVPATFFVIGRQVPGYADTMRRMADQGCEIASHTWDHPNLAKQSHEGIVGQITATADAIEAAAGVRPALLRPPYGEVSDTVRAAAAQLGVYLINWSVDTLDWKSQDAAAVYEHILANARDGCIILCHDLYQSTLDAMELAIPALIDEGYQLVTVSQLLELDSGAREAGVVYRHR